MTIENTSVTLLRFPRDDLDFEAVLDRIASAVGSLAHLGPESFQEHLRQTYPGAVVHAQDPLGGFRTNGSAWYVYRDGSPLTR
jgi:hypothetical protein